MRRRCSPTLEALVRDGNASATAVFCLPERPGHSCATVRDLKKEIAHSLASSRQERLYLVQLHLVKSAT